MARLPCERYLTDCDNCGPQEHTLMNQHVNMSEYAEIIEETVKEKIKSSEKAHRVKPCKVGPGCLVFLKVNP